MGDKALNAAALVVAPVPPFAIASVPASVTAPVVAVAGVRPVVPPETLKTPVFAMVTGDEPL
jgi:hypothetical protein